MASKAFKGHYDLEKAENITDLYGKSNKEIEKKIAPAGVIRSHSARLKAQDPSFLPSFVHPACDIKFADTREELESLGVKSTTQRNLEHKAPSVRALCQ